MPSRTQHLVMLIAILSGALLVSGHLSAQEKKTTRPSQHAALELTGIKVSGRTSLSGRTNPDADPAQEQNHCFKFAPESDLNLTISAADNKGSFPKSGRVKVEIINLQLLDSARANGPSISDRSPIMKYEFAIGTIKDGQAIVTFKGDVNATLREPFNAYIHMGSPDPAVNKIIGSPYSNVALITLPSPRNAANAEPVKYIYYYHVYTKQPSECTQKP